MVLEYDGCLCIEVDGNGFVGELLVDVVGIVVMFFVLNQFCVELVGMVDVDVLIDCYYYLVVFVSEYVEVVVIYWVID